jgi:hypothetical protein
MSPTKSKPSSELSELALVLLWADVLRDLAMEESRAGQQARTILRAERDGQGESARHLVEALGRAIVQAMPRVRTKDPQTGRWRLNLTLPEDWRG